MILHVITPRELSLILMAICSFVASHIAGELATTVAVWVWTDNTNNHRWLKLWGISAYKWVRGYVICWAVHGVDKSHNSKQWADKRLIFTLAKIPPEDEKYSWRFFNHRWKPFTSLLLRWRFLSFRVKHGCTSQKGAVSLVVLEGPMVILAFHMSFSGMYAVFFFGERRGGGGGREH